jgi:hypothetical protein
VTDFLDNSPKPLTIDHQRFLGESSFLNTLFDYYEAAGKLAKLPPEDVVRQFEAEYVCSIHNRHFFESKLTYR